MLFQSVAAKKKGGKKVAAQPQLETGVPRLSERKHSGPEVKPLAGRLAVQPEVDLLWLHFSLGALDEIYIY